MVCSKLEFSVLNASIGFGAVVTSPFTAAELLQDADVCQQLVTLWRDHGGLVVVRGLTDMTAQLMADLSAKFGVVEQTQAENRRKFQVDGVSSVVRLGNTRDDENNLTAMFVDSAMLPADGSCQYSISERKPVWHTDSTFRKCPPIGSLLFCKQAPPSGGETCFADMRTAYQDLDEAHRERLLDLECVCSITHHDAKMRKTQKEFPAPSAEQRASNPAQRVPMVLFHPITGRPALYGLNSGTCHVVKRGTEVDQSRMDAYELNAEEDESVQKEWRDMLPRITSQRHVAVWKWEAGDLLLWDNRCTIHCATGFDHQTYVREMWRTTLTSDLKTA